MKIFGFELTRKKQKDHPISIDPSNEEGSVTVGGGAGSTYLDMAVSFSEDSLLINKYREVSLYPEIDNAIDEIVNEAIVVGEDSSPISLNLEEANIPKTVKNKIQEQFEIILKLLNYSNNCSEMFKNWYVDGRLFYAITLNENKKGIRKLEWLDSSKMKKVIKYDEITNKQQECFFYKKSESNQIQFSVDSVAYSYSGIVDRTNNKVISYLHKCLKTINQLRMLEDSVLIYRISRAPERRIFYVDVGNLPKDKAEQYVSNLMNKFRNKVTYDADTGEYRDSKRHLSLMEDYWMPRRGGSGGTEITSLPGGQNLGEMDDVYYFQKKLFQTLNIPTSRLQEATPFSSGRSQEITREEVKFNKFIMKLRRKYSKFFLQLLKVQLVSNNILTLEEFEELQNDINFNFLTDNSFFELQKTEILINRLQSMQQIEPYVGLYYSKNWVRKHVLMQTEDEIKIIDEELSKETPIEDKTGKEQNAE